MSRWDAGDRSGGLADLADVFERLEKLDQTASRQNQRVHQFARGIGGLFFHDAEDFYSTSRPVVAYGGASALSTRDEPLAKIELRPLADNWEVLALVEESLGLDVGVAARSRTRETQKGVPALRALRAQIEYRKALIEGVLTKTVLAGINAASRLKPMLEGMSADASTFETASIPDMMTIPAVAKALRQIPLDAAIRHKLAGNPIDAPFLLLLEEAISASFRGDQSLILILRTLDGTHTQDFELEEQYVARAAIVQDSAISADPELLFRWGLIMVTHLAQSLARQALEAAIVHRFSSGWQHVLTHQQSMLSNPIVNASAIASALKVNTNPLSLMARTLIAAAPAVRFSLSSSQISFLRHFIQK